MEITDLLLPTYRQKLQALSGWLRKAEEREGGADALMAARLAPDMFPLATQVRFACVQAREGVHRLRHEALPPAVEELLNEGRAGGERPGTVAEALARIDQTVGFVDGVAQGALDAAAPKPLALELPMGLAFDLTGDNYVRDWALPQFYFHITTAYAILRHEGVVLGKADYVPYMFAHLRPGTAPGA